MKQTFRFYKTPANRWYVDLPEWEGEIAELEMVMGADTMLAMISESADECHLAVSDEPFDGADNIKLIEDLRHSIGGGNYLLETYKGESINQEMWLCAVTEFVFQYLPEHIYISPVSK